MPEHLRQRLSDARRHLHPRLHRHRRSGPRPRSCPAPPDRRARRRPLRGLQRRHRTGRFGAGAGPRIRTGQRTETQLPLCAAPRRRHHGDLGRSHAGEHPPGLACRAAARRNAPHGLAMATAPRAEITFPQTETEDIAESASGTAPDALSAYSSLPLRHPAPAGPSHRTDRLPCACKGFFHLFRNRKEKRLIFFVFLHQLGK